MNRGQVFYSSLVQQMIGGDQNNNNLWIDMNSSSSRPNLEENHTTATLNPLSQFVPASCFLPVMPPWPENHDQPESLSLSQLLLSGVLPEEERYAYTIASQSRKLENWDVKSANKPDQYVYNGAAANGNHEEIQGPKSQWNQLLPASSPRSCITTTSLGSNMLDFSNNIPDRRPHQSDNSSECNSTATGSALKKARVQVTSSAQSTLKVRKERLGDRITALHQIVSPFGKTDTASVLQETIGYIRFLVSQIEALTDPYLGHGPTTKTMQPVQGERNCLFPEYPGQVGKEEKPKDLKSRGLCLVPVSCTSHLGTDTTADYWPAALGTAFR
ncbi:basic helix-loop-helix (bHLH) DNA-binding superfamily protein [Rhynchospora pubera]|uniref:Basic helix-loop-helix (BHLH) DNA-binding superfamily protein n=1 Tax=Rhynchospora pubera TaxID=906938 RepID=A0AAV8FLW3_9POAL|nr:basic helix-loop-helix (bHLH) DNA-binding superfamily protein [Rhynchospora pubera]